MKTFYLNCIESGYNLLTGLLEAGVSIDHIISLSPEQAKKHNVSGYRDFSTISDKYNIPIYYPQKFSLNGERDIEFIKKEAPDLMMVLGWQRLIPTEVIDELTIGALGAHGSSEFLPKGRGRSPINWSLIEGKDRFIIHLFYIDPGVDSGDIIDWVEFDINAWDTCKTIYHKVQISLKRMILRSLPLIQRGEEKRIQQNDKEATYYPKRTPEDGEINWSKSTEEIYNLVRAVTRPYPGAFTPNKKLMIWKAQPFDSKIKYDECDCGQVVELFDQDGFVIKTLDGTLYVTDWDGASPQVGDSL